MTTQEIATELLREWQECPADELQLMKELAAVHLSVNTDSDRAWGVFDDMSEGHQGETK